MMKRIPSKTIPFNPIAAKMAKVFIAGIALAAFFVTPAAAREQLRMGMSQYPSTFHPAFDAMLAKSIVLGAALRPVTAHDANWQPVCMLCTELPSYENGRVSRVMLDNGKKGLAVTYTLQPDLYWGDGTPLTTKDILFAWDVGRHPQSGVSNSEFFMTSIHKVVAKDDKTFVIEFSKEICDFDTINDFYPLPEHLERKIFDENPAEYKNRSLYMTAPATAGLYAGPYIVSKAESGARVTLTKNPYWRGFTPSFDTVSFRIIENSTALSSALLAGEIDYITGELGLPLDSALSFEKRLPAGKYNVTYKAGLTYEHIDFNLDVAPFGDVRVRRALMHAMNRAAINDAIFSGRQPPANTMINPLDTVYTADTQVYAHDPARAAALLDEAGWKTGDDGWRYNASGEKLSITLQTTAGNKTRETILQAIQADWKKAGIDVTIQNLPARVLFGDTLRDRKFKSGIMYAWMSSPQNIPKTTLHSNMIPSEKNGYAGQNYPGYADAKMDALLDNLETTCDKNKRQPLWDALQKQYADELPALPLYYRAEAFIVPAWLSGVTPTGHLHPSTLWIENWKETP